MGKNIIVSEETVRDLLEAHASLSAWYYELWAALRAANPSPRPPDDAARAAFVEPLAAVFPELSSVVKSIRVPRMFVPSPPAVALATAAAVASQAPEARAAEPVHSAPQEPAPPAEPAAAAPQDPAIAPPPFVVPSQVKYDP